MEWDRSPPSLFSPRNRGAEQGSPRFPHGACAVVGLVLVVLLSASGAEGLVSFPALFPPAASHASSVGSHDPAVRGDSASDAPAGRTAPVRLAPGPAVVASPSSGPVGTNVTFSGTGFAATVPLTTISWSWSSFGTPTCPPGTDGSGSFVCTGFVFPSTTAGWYNLTAADSDGNTAQGGFYLAPNLTVTPSNVTVGSSVSFHGSGFGASVPVTVDSDWGTACATNSNPVGAFACTYQVPAAPFGGYLFNATDGNHSANVSLSIHSNLTLSPSSGTDGSNLTLQGTGFDANVLATGTTSNGVIGPACQGMTDADGSFTCASVVPWNASFDGFQVHASDPSGHPAEAFFQPLPSLVLTPSRGPGGTVSSVNGYGWLPQDPVPNVASVSLDGETVCAEAPNDAGSFVCPSVVIPLGPAGSVLLSASSTISGRGMPPFDLTAHTNFDRTTNLSLAASTLPMIGEAGIPVRFVANASLGTGPYAYLWNFGDGGTSSAPDPDHAFALAGNYTVSVTATDSTGSSVLTWLNITIQPALHVVGLTATPDPIEAGQFVGLSVITLGGVGPFSYNWSGLNDCAGMTVAPAFGCVQAKPGPYLAEVTVADADGGVGVATTTVLVFPPLAVPILYTSQPVLDVGQTVTFGATVFGGEAPYTYYWSLLPGDCSLGNVPQISCLTTAAGVFKVYVSVLDALGNEGASLPISLTVSPALVVTLSGATTQAVVGQTSSFTALASGGSGNFTYEWAVNGIAQSSVKGMILNLTTDYPGTYLITVDVSDYAGVVVESEPVTLTVIYPATSVASTTGSGPTPLEWAFLAMGVALLVIVAFVVGQGWRRPSDSTKLPPPAASEAKPPASAAPASSSAVIEYPAHRTGPEGPGASSNSAKTPPTLPEYVER
jgi:hypothetical protein